MKATAQAGANIAIVKYWGNLDASLNLPLNSSISLTLDQANTIVTVEFSPNVGEDRVEIEGRPAAGYARERVIGHLNHLRQMGGTDAPARVASRSTFPPATGLAFSASFYAALTVAGLAALGLAVDPRTVSTVARLGSGSAARSVYGGWVEWVAGASHEESYAQVLAPRDWWAIRDVIAIVSDEPKAVPSTVGHAAAVSSPCHQGRLARTTEHLAMARTAIRNRDLALLGQVAEEQALLLHAVAMTGTPRALYWLPGTVAVMQQVLAWREEGWPAYFTLDAGPNVHVLTTVEDAPRVAASLCAIPGMQRTLVCAPGGPPVLGDVHLF